MTIKLEESMKQWTPQMQQVAAMAGWWLATILLKKGFTVEVQRIDDENLIPEGGTHLVDDRQAINRVYYGQDKASQLARNIVKAHCSREWRIIKQVVGVR